ncbi:MAG: extracellular solute-binding protein [Chloroflexia bacterium]|nr:extracellular solute-binding protein [Chloroflexia bacterium]
MTHMLSRRRFVGGSAAAAATLGLAQMTTAGALASLARIQDGPTAIDYWHRSSGNAAAEWEKLAAAFNEEMAGSVAVTAIAQGDIQELNQKIRAAASGGGLPGATMGDDYDITQYAANEIIVDIDPFLNDPENGLTAEEQADFLPNQFNRHKLTIYDDRRMAFPQGFSAFTCFWNADALQAAGFDEPPATWQEFPDHVRAVAEANPGMTGWNIGGAGDRFISVLLTHGVQWLADDGQTSNFDRPEALEIMTWWKQLGDEGLLAVIDGDDARNAFTSGTAAYFMDSSGNTADILAAAPAFTWDCGLPPQGADNPEPVTETYGPVNAIPTNDEAMQLAGWLWLKWLTTPAAMAQWVMATDYFPSRVSVAESPELTAYYEGNPYAAKLVQEVAPLARILSPSPALTQVRGQITADVVNEVLLGRLTPEDGVLKLKVEADAAIEEASA